MNTGTDAWLFLSMNEVIHAQDSSSDDRGDFGRVRER